LSRNSVISNCCSDNAADGDDSVDHSRGSARRERDIEDFNHGMDVEAAKIVVKVAEIERREGYVTSDKCNQDF
jgi:hypothetical protein